MKKQTHLLVAAALLLTLVSVQAQPGRGGPPGGGSPASALSGSLLKLFGNNTAYSATLEFEMKLPSQPEPMTMSSKTAVDGNRSRLEMDMTQMKGLPPQAIDQLKAMGMDRSVLITRPDKKLLYTVYPNMQAYTEMEVPEMSATNAAADFKLETTELGKETVNGHACVKNKAVITDDKGAQHEATVWNATDLKNFPVKIETTERGQAMTMSFKDVKLAKPDAGLFEPPAGFKKYTMEQFMQEMMNRGGGPGGRPGGPPRGQ